MFIYSTSTLPLGTRRDLGAAAWLPSCPNYHYVWKTTQSHDLQCSPFHMTSAITWAIWAAADTDFVTHSSVSHHQHNNNSGHFYIAPYLTNKGEHTALYKINNNGYIKTSKIINYIVIILHFPPTHTLQWHKIAWKSLKNLPSKPQVWYLCFSALRLTLMSDNCVSV